MKFRLSCANCRASFMVAGDPVPDVVVCPECGRPQRVPPIGTDLTSGSALSSEPGVSVFVPSGRNDVESKKPRSWRTYAALAVCLLLIAGGLSSWPWLKQAFWKAESKDPVERVARSYLDALVRDDSEEANRLGTVEEPPAIRSFGEVSRIQGRDSTLKGRFGPIAKLNKRIDEKFSYDPKIGRFTPKNSLGAAGETLDALHEAKEQAEKSGIYDKMASGDPNDLFDAAENYGKVFTKLAAGALAPRRILPTYAMLVNDSKPPLPDTEKELALDYGENHATWDGILKRPFLTLRADGPYVLDRAEVLTTVYDKLASLGDPPSTLRLKLVRFRLEGIDTGWKIISAERVSESLKEEDATPSYSGDVDAARSESGSTPGKSGTRGSLGHGDSSGESP